MTDVSAVKHWAHREAKTYRQGKDRPLAGYLGAMGVYASAVAGLTLLARRLGFRPPDRISPWDVALLGIATHRVTRTMAKDAVVSPVRAPFTTYQQPGGAGRGARGGTHRLRRRGTRSANCSPARSAWDSGSAPRSARGWSSPRAPPGWWRPPSPAWRCRTSCSTATAPCRARRTDRRTGPGRLLASAGLRASSVVVPASPAVGSGTSRRAQSVPRMGHGVAQPVEQAGDRPEHQVPRRLVRRAGMRPGRGELLHRLDLLADLDQLLLAEDRPHLREHLALLLGDVLADLGHQRLSAPRRSRDSDGSSFSSRFMVSSASACSRLARSASASLTFSFTLG